VIGVTQADITRMRDQVFFEGAERGRRLSRFWLLLVLSTVIASAGIVSNSTATVIGAMIVAPLMTPILGIVLGVVLADTGNLRRCLVLLAAGAWRGSPAAWREDLVRVAGASARSATPQERKALHRLGGEPVVAILTTGQDDVLHVAASAGYRSALSGPFASPTASRG